MREQNLAEIIIYIHAFFGGVALFTGAIALMTKKGGKAHKRSGKVFYYSMLISAVLSLIIAALPHHISPFLFSIGLFSIYFLVSGYRSLNFKNPNHNFNIDKILSYLIFIIGVVMIFYPILLDGAINIVLLVFGIVALFFGTLDIKRLRNPSMAASSWLNLHIGKMTGGYIAAVSAFFVVNQILPSLWNWFAPGIVGGLYFLLPQKAKNLKRKETRNNWVRNQWVKKFFIK